MKINTLFILYHFNQNLTVYLAGTVTKATRWRHNTNINTPEVTDKYTYKN